MERNKNYIIEFQYVFGNQNTVKPALMDTCKTDTSIPQKFNLIFHYIYYLAIMGTSLMGTKDR